MTPEGPSGPAGAPVRKSRFTHFNNWISAAGAVVALGSLFAFLLLFALDLITPGASPYLGILTFLVAPFFLIIGLVLVFIGWLAHRRHLSRRTGEESPLRISLDFSKPAERRKFALFVGGATVFLFLTALGSYRTYHFTESNLFCGEVCHTVMEPEYVTYQKSPHARVACVDCHIGEGAKWYVKAKIDGLYQVYATLANIYPRPIPTPITSLRPAQDTCEKCHWPQVFTGNLDRTHQRHLSDTANTPFAVRLILQVGGGDPRLGAVEGIHWHTDPRNRVEYIAVDERRLDIPWVRLRREGGEEAVFLREGFADLDALAAAEVRVMDCIDCHNRPAHILLSPNDAVDQAITLRRLDPAYPELRHVAVNLLAAGYATREAAEAAIRDGLRQRYAGMPGLERTIAEVQRIYRENFFPLMKSDWAQYPNHLGHKNWPGCFRCHGGEHFEATTGAPLQPTSCNSCHLILAQGAGEELLQLSAVGQDFRHPEGDVDGLLCHYCHTGGPQ